MSESLREFVKSIDREIVKSKSLKELAGSVMRSAVESYTKNMSLVDRMTVKFGGWFVKKEILPLQWDYAVDRAIDYLNEKKADIKRIGMDANGGYKSVGDVAMALFALLTDDTYFTGQAVSQNRLLEKYR